MKRGQLTAGLIAALIVGIALGYLFTPPKTTVETTTTPITVTQEITKTVTTTEVITRTETMLQTITQTVTQTVTATQTVTVTPQTYTQTQTPTQTESEESYIIDLTPLIQQLLQQTPPPGAPQPLLKPVYVASAVINGTVGGAVETPPLLVVVPPGTYVKIRESTLRVFNLTVVLYPPPATPPPDNSTPVLAFAYFVDGYSGAEAQFVDDKGRPKPLITVAEVPNMWSSWAYAGYTTEGLAIRGGRYVFKNRWIDAGGYQVNLQFVRPIAWIFTSTDSKNPALQRVEDLRGQPPGLVPISAVTLEVNNETGGAAALGNLIAVVQPGTYLKTGDRLLSRFNFTLVYLLASNITGVRSLTPLSAFAFAFNGRIDPALSLVNRDGEPMPVVTIAHLPPHVTSWTWIPASPASYKDTLRAGSYRFPNAWITAGRYSVNLQFFRPVVWVFLANTTTQQTPQEIITIYAYDNYFVPDGVKAPLGATVKFIVINMGRVAHTFDIDELGIRSGPIAPGSRYESPPIHLTAPGRYIYYCRYHYGMMGYLEVS